MATQRQVLANQRNGLKGGVKTEEGKAVSRMNARKHSIFASALTPEDSKEAHGIEDDLISSLRPVGRVEEMLVEKLALTYLRMQRCARAEAEYHIRTWAKPNKYLQSHEWERWQEKRDHDVRAVPFREQEFERIVKLIDLYDARLTSQFLKLLHEIERLQRLRAGEDVPPPVVADLTIQTDAGDVAQPTEAVVCPVPVEASEQAPEDAVADAQPRSASGTVPHTEEAPAPPNEKPQHGDGQEDSAQKGFEKTNPIS